MIACNSKTTEIQQCVSFRQYVSCSLVLRKILSVCSYLHVYCVCMCDDRVIVFVFVCIFNPHPGVLCVNKRARFPRGKPKHTYITRCFRSSPESEFTVALLAHSHHLLSPVPSVFRTCNIAGLSHTYTMKRQTCSQECDVFR